jgi:aryl-alcohol dehydrogenase-like predicted oxidoreductase
MEIRNLGSQGLKTSQLGLGCMGMSEFYGAGNDEESITVIHKAIDLGITFLDTADMYGPFTNEQLVGRALHSKRNQVTLATKFGIVRNPTDPKQRGINGRPEYVKASCDASLKRLNTDVIDLYYLHRVDTSTPIEETVGAMSDLVKAGKIRGIGLSEVSVNTLKRAHAIHPISAVQTEYSLWTRDPEEGILIACKDLGIGFVPYSPLGRGFLTGQIRKFDDLSPNDFRRISPRFQGENFQKNLDLVNKIEGMARKKGCTSSQLALAWVMAQGDFLFPIPGTKRLKYLEENFGSVKISLTADELSEIDRVAPRGIAAGLRYPEAGMKSLNN